MNAPREKTRPPRAHPRAVSVTSRLCDYLASKGLKRSRQRDRIAEVFFGMDGHVSVEDVVARVRREDPRVSVATVYRTMKLLADCGLATSRQFGGGHARWEAAAGRRHHDHLVCTSCGAIVEFSNDDIEALQDLVARRHGFAVESHTLELYGRCSRCKRADGAVR